MTKLRVAPIVEGDGEVQAVPILLRRIWCEMLGGDYIDVLRPFRLHRSDVLGDRETKLTQALNLAVLSLKVAPGDPLPGCVLVLMDRDPSLEPTCVLGPRLLNQVERLRSDAASICVIADVEYESWFVAAASSLANRLALAGENVRGIEASNARFGKRWIRQRMPGRRYKETVDQPSLTALMDLALCRRNSTSFDKLCRELEKRLR